MIAYTLGLVTGSALVAGRLAIREWLVQRRAPASHELSAEEQRSIADSFAVHAQAVHEQVTSYADALADGDPVLRERLRQFEQGVH